MISIPSIKAFLFELNFESRHPSLFCQRLYALIAGCSFYHFDETSYEHYRPEEVPDYALERSYFKRQKRRVAIWKKIDAAFGLEKLEAAYEMFDDERSKHLFLLRILNNVYDRLLVRFPLFYSKQYQKLSKIAALADETEAVSLWNGLLTFMKYPLRKIGVDLTLWGGPDGIFIEFLLDQYSYKDIVSIEDGDNIIDGGACYGDTALHFATQTSGQIYSFEFMRENVELFHKNMELNPKYKDRVTLVERPLGARSDEKLYAVFNGPGTSISDKKTDGAVEFSSITIDDFVKENGVEKIDFIKFDIEGSEENALRGATETIRKFKPKLAICGYHKKDDLIVLPKLIKELLPEYSLYLDHHTINNTETVIYAAVKKKI
ncbi:FkbM family methyltransferase [uncultured Pseudodesulfovibrio sp.]|uniref:FkbM family methyltransferase n=1 Tax=uncultured Pseudodesulfovibrio sp. TaxID=2035858 RepID=UPI0029C691E5|nr:FkbM family methyltransferase [uncultured Pseudodesulfovibrio sp.]